MGKELLFSEQQYWDIWTWLLLLIVNCIVIASVVYEGKFVNKNTGVKIAVPKPVSYSIVAIILAGSIFFLNFRLDTEIRVEGVYVRFFPLQRQFKKFLWQDTDTVFVKEYKPFKEYGGWGIRGHSDDKVYSMSGRKGIQIVLTNGSKFMIGTGQPEKATDALQEAKRFYKTKY